MQTSDQFIYTVRHRQIELRFDPITDQLSALVEDHDGLCLSLYREPGSELPVGLIRERILKWGQAEINLTAVPAGDYLLFVTTVPFELTWDGNH